MKKEKSVAGSFLALRPPSEFAFTGKAGISFSHPLLTTARQRAATLFSEVSICDLILTFARTFFENEVEKL